RHPRPHRSPVVISDVQYDSPGPDLGSNHSLNQEWVDIRNTGGRAVDLDEWTLSNRDGDTYTFRDLHLDAGSTVRVHTGIGRDGEYDVYQDLRHYVWDNRSDTATLSDHRGRVVDTESWERDRYRHHHHRHH
ncbi:lamin tail domain-containing protein, partial [Streptomyces sp. GC420]|uniref:lamin tail domain-containing protein n=1 Tax=Streptomyces sp. GC420 TaxID=2697568 RepID=UPI0014151252